METSTCENEPENKTEKFKWIWIVFFPLLYFLYVNCCEIKINTYFKTKEADLTTQICQHLNKVRI